MPIPRACIRRSPSAQIAEDVGIRVEIEEGIIDGGEVRSLKRRLKCGWPTSRNRQRITSMSAARRCSAAIVGS